MFDKNHRVFTGIVESSTKLTHFATPNSSSKSLNNRDLSNINSEDTNSDSSVYRISIKRPAQFTDIKEGDSICVNGVCLTIVDFDDQSMHFDVGPETLQVTGWSAGHLINKDVNLERSMKFGDRIHGHFLSGHVDEVATIISSAPNGEAWDINLKLSVNSKNYVWKKGSLGISGVSLTVNQFEDYIVSVCLIPETIKLTNLTSFKKGDSVNIEFDWMAKAFFNQIKNMGLNFGSDSVAKPIKEF